MSVGGRRACNAKAMTVIAIDMLSDDDLLKQARTEWEARTAGTPYIARFRRWWNCRSRARAKKTGVLLGAGASPFTAAPLSRSKPT
jgi:hypothetical protein